MATRKQSNSHSDYRLGRRYLNLFKVLLIVLFALQPGYAGPPPSKSSGSGGGCGSSGSASAPPPSSRVSEDLYNDYSSVSGSDHLLAASTLVESIDGDAYVGRLLNGTGHPDIRLPGYSYFQGLIQANNHVTVAGQVRIVGGVMGASGIDDGETLSTSGDDGTLNLYQGAMVTVNGQAFADADDLLLGTPSGIKTRVKTWKEVRSP